MGSVFSPYYALARRFGRADPLDHCAFNIAVYGRRVGRWAMTERGHRSVSRDACSFAVGRSSMRWTGGSLEIVVDEVCAPLPRRVRGRVRLTPSVLCDRSFDLAPGSRHRWSPLAPCARAEVRLTEPELRFEGPAYLDSNCGDEPLERGFSSWTWSRAALPGGTVVLYDVVPRRTAPHSLALQFASDGAVDDIEPPATVRLRTTGWRVARHTRADPGHEVRVLKTLEDAPFYCRSLLDTHLMGSPAAAIHESLSLDRFNSPWVQCLLPFRMPRNS